MNGLNELLDKKPSTISAEVFPNSQLCFLDKSTLKEILLNNEHELSNSLKDILEIKHNFLNIYKLTKIDYILHYSTLHKKYP